MAWESVHLCHVGDRDGIPCSWLWPVLWPGHLGSEASGRKISVSFLSLFLNSSSKIDKSFQRGRGEVVLSHCGKRWDPNWYSHGLKDPTVEVTKVSKSGSWQRGDVLGHHLVTISVSAPVLRTPFLPVLYNTFRYRCFGATFCMLMNRNRSQKSYVTKPTLFLSSLSPSFIIMFCYSTNATLGAILEKKPTKEQNWKFHRTEKPIFLREHRPRPIYAIIYFSKVSRKITLHIHWNALHLLLLLL